MGKCKILTSWESKDKWRRWSCCVIIQDAWWQPYLRTAVVLRNYCKFILSF